MISYEEDDPISRDVAKAYFWGGVSHQCVNKNDVRVNWLNWTPEASLKPYFKHCKKRIHDDY